MLKNRTDQSQKVRNSTKESTIVVVVIGTIFVVERGCEYDNDKFGKKTNSNYELN